MGSRPPRVLSFPSSSPIVARVRGDFGFFFERDSANTKFGGDLQDGAGLEPIGLTDHVDEFAILGSLRPEPGG